MLCAWTQEMKIKILFKLVPVLFLAACGQPKPIPYESLAWVNNYYIEHPTASLSSTAGGWLFRGAREYNGELRVGFLIPEPMSENPDKRQAILDRICPLKSEEIWQILPSQHDLVITVWTRDNKFKDSITC